MTYEEHRFWDCRRWKEAPDEDILAQIPTYKADGTVQYPIQVIDHRPFDSKMYRMPIPESETFADPELKQNPGWNMSEETSED